MCRKTTICSKLSRYNFDQRNSRDQELYTQKSFSRGISLSSHIFTTHTSPKPRSALFNSIINYEYFQIETHAGHGSYGSSAPSGYSASSSGWDSYGGGHDAHGSYSNNVGQTLAYGGQKPVAR